MFWKLFGSYGILVVTSIVLLGAFVTHRSHQELLRNVEHALRAQAILLEPTVVPILDGGERGGRQEFIRSLAESAGVRITVINPNGVVLEDSASLPTSMENHAQRPEILSLRDGVFASDTRASDTLSAQFSYLAMRLPQNSEVPKGYLRLAVRVDRLQDRIAEMRWMVWGAAAISGAIALLLGLFWANHFSSRLDQLSRTAASIAEGDYDLPINVSGSDQIGTLAHALQRMRRQLTEHIAESERTRAELETMLETMPEGVVAVDPDLRILFANHTTYKLFGLHRRDIAGRSVGEVLPHPGLQEALAKTQASEEGYSTEFEVLHPYRVIEYRGTSLYVGSRRGILMVLHDVTDLRRLERMRQDFLANVSHELKTPLAAIKAYTETLLDGADADEQTCRRFLCRIEEQADRLHALVVDMLMLARVESKEQAFDIQAVDLHECVREVLRSFEESAAAKRVTLCANLAPEDCFVAADHEGLATILGNLVDNAVKYTRENGRVEISTRQEGDDVILCVVDDGIGIPQEDLGRIFERFYRVDKARSRELGGTGLGLSIVKHLTQTFGGSVAVDSRLHEGATFTVRLAATNPDPLVQQTDDVADSTPPLNSTRRQSSSGNQA